MHCTFFLIKNCFYEEIALIEGFRMNPIYMNSASFAMKRLKIENVKTATSIKMRHMISVCVHSDYELLNSAGI